MFIIKVIAKDTNNISYTVRYGLGFPIIDYTHTHSFISVQLMNISLCTDGN